MSKNIEILYNLAQKGCITHSGHFHADDIFSAALLKIVGIVPDVSVIQRVGSVPENFNGLAFDIGGGEFDHHQQNAAVRLNGKKYAAFGLLWNAIGAEYIADKYNTDMNIAKIAAENFDTEFVTLMDLTDNFGSKVYPNPLAYLIATRNNGNYTEEERAIMFQNIANEYCVYLESGIKSVYDFINYKNIARKLAVSDVITLTPDTFIPISAFENTKTKYIVKLSTRGTYNIMAVNPYKIAPKYKKLPGCIQVYNIGAAFDNYTNALNAAHCLVEDLQIKSM
ncbi:MAG: MYG1 family protein [Alphaproteobacteria bacterium]|nr:MYG1 family protein [Alphaproteobacteria bacterium]